jgi:lipopolysaccharide export system protein LptC
MSDALRRQAKRAANRATLARKLGLAAVIGGGLVLALFLWQSAAFGWLVPAPQKVEPVAKTSQIITASTSTFTGLDQSQKPFEVQAVNALQDQTDADLVHLDGVQGKFTRIEGRETTVASNKANYNTKSKALDLSGQVVVEEKGHFTAKLDNAVVDLDGKGMTSKGPVTVDIPGGKVEAEAMVVDKGGVHIVFSGKVRASFKNEFATTTVKGEGG